MADDETYLYLNEGGFTPGMYEPHKAEEKSGPAETKRSSWWWLPGFDRGEKRPRETTRGTERIEA